MNAGDALAEGQMLDTRYRVKRVLGVGGMGRVYMANDTRLANRPVAVKEMIVGDGVQEKKAVEDFAREARVLALLSHPGIPSLIDYFVENARHYLVMEFVAGGDLQHMLDQLGSGARFPEDKVLRWARQILDVLDFLHGQTPPIVYRDLKPGNIMIDKDGRAMLIDFGIARFLPPGGRGTQIGSIGYAPPEQYTGKTEPRSDLFSLAATMHHLLTGRDPTLEPPFSFPPIRSINSAISQQTADAVMRALEKELDKRPKNARAMLGALPDPGPDYEKSSPILSGASRGPNAAVATVVLANPTATPAPSSIRSTPSRQSSPVQPSNAPSSMRTIVLTDTVPSSPSSSRTPAARGSSPTTRRAGEITEKAIALLGRGIKAGIKVITPITTTEGTASARVSATAKTSELNHLGAATPINSRPATPVASRPVTPMYHHAQTSQGNPASTNMRPAGGPLTAQQQPASPTAWLVSRADGAQFGIVGMRALIGRSTDSSDGLDINLAAMRNAADRVSRRHAEIIKRGPEFFIRDLGSTNGTYIVGRGKLGRDQLYPLKDRDQVVLGNAILLFRKS